MIDPDKIPDIRPDRRKFWLLRALVWLLFVAGLAALAYAGLVGTLAYYATKNGSEVSRLYGESAHVLIAAIAGILTMAVGQLFRVIMAIEENTRLIAFNTRPRPRAAEPPRRSVVPQDREQMRA
jgi:uncharacterized ion transporter superfamily protein YfcC